MPATLQLTREAGFGFELRRGTFQVLLDGAPVQTIDWRETIEEPVEPGHHVLRISVGRYSSGDHAFDASDAGVVRFRCHGAMLWPRYVASLVKPDWGISLRRE